MNMAREQTKEAKYLYCIIKCGEERSFNGVSAIGGRGDGIHTVGFGDLACVVSDSPDMKYDSTRANMMAHETVIEQVMEEFTVLPIRFGTVTRKGSDSPVEDIRHKLLESRGKEFLSLHEEIARMVEEAVRFSQDDQKRREEVEISIKADNMVRAARQTIKEADLETNLDLVDEVERAILEVQTALASGDSAEIKSRTEALEKEVKVLYRQTKYKPEAYISDKSPQHEYIHKIK